MGLTYKSIFKDNANNAYEVRIYTQTQAQTVEDLYLQTSSVQIEYASEDIFDPKRASKATINLLVNDIKPDLFAGGNHDVYVEIDKNEEIFWMGYVTPNLYSQTYELKYDSMSLECVDFIADLKNYKYNYIRSASDTISSLLDVITHCLNYADPDHNIKKIYVDSSIYYRASNRILENLSISERNFFDEKEEPEQCDEVVNEILKYFELTIFQYKDAFYIFKLGENLFNIYSLNLYSYTNGAWAFTQGIHSKSWDIQSSYQIGIGDTACDISMDDVYNKVTVIANSNPQDGLLPDYDDADDLENQHSDPPGHCDPNHYEEATFSSNDTDYTLMNGYFNSKNNWAPIVNINGQTQTSTVAKLENQQLNYVNEVTNAVLGDGGDANVFVGYNYGIVWQKTNDYVTAEGEPATLSWKTYISFWDLGWNYYATRDEYLKLKKNNILLLEGGYLIANMKYRLSSQYRANTSLRSLNKEGEERNPTYHSGNDFPEYILWPAKVKIGDVFYNGEEWINQTDYDNKVTWWNSTYNFGTTTIDYVNSHTYYRIKNTTYNDWEYVTQATYNSFSGTRETGNTGTPAYAVIRYDSGTTDIWVQTDFIKQVNYGQYCYFVSKNNTGEPIFDNEKSFMNTVSYKMNLTNSESGYAIPLPDNRILYGALSFELHTPFTMTGQFGSIQQILNTPVQAEDTISERYTICTAIHISDLKINYTKQNIGLDIYNLQKDSKNDVTYTNIINQAYCTEMDDVELKVNTYYDSISSYSYIIYKNGNTIEYVKGLKYGNTTASDEVPEKHLINRLVQHHSSPKIIYANVIKNNTSTGGTEIWPMHPIRETIGGSQKNLITTNAVYDLGENTVSITTTEI